jgi:hypothetical protein
MDAMTTERPTIGHNARMTDAEYEHERAKIAPTKVAAGIRWEQELAALFYRSGWSTAELAKREGQSKANIAYLVKFGQFLSFLQSSTYLDEAEMARLTGRRFRAYWARTQTPSGKIDPLGIYDRDRFREAAQLMAEESDEWLKQGWQLGVARSGPRLPPDTSIKLIKKCGDGKWRSAEQIASKVGLEADQAHKLVTHSLTSSHRDKCDVETKKVGKETHFRIFKKDKTVSTDELTEKLTPILEELEAEGKKNMATMVPAKVAMLTARIKQLLKEWAE